MPWQGGGETEACAPGCRGYKGNTAAVKSSVAAPQKLKIEFSYSTPEGTSKRTDRGESKKKCMPPCSCYVNNHLETNKQTKTQGRVNEKIDICT